MVTLPTTEPPPSGPKLESLTHIDITKLSQSELHTLSLCSTTAFDLHNTDDVIIPQIDRRFFNESAGSHRQTYSRLRLSSAGHRTRLPGLLPIPKPSPTPSDPEHSENKSIVNSLKNLLENGNSPNNNQFLLPDMQIVVYSGEGKRKRVRKRKEKVPERDVELEIVNKNGVVVDLRALENGDELVGEELRRRIVGLESEEEVLGFLRDLEGEWGSRRKKRKIVDASEFGDWLPVDWKLLLGLKRREGRVSVYCRRYISPNGQQFVSCKEASLYLQSYFGLNDASLSLNQMGDNSQQVCGVTSENHAGFVHENDILKQDNVPNSALPSSSNPSVQEMELSLMGIDNLPEVQVQDLFECYKCNMTFDEKNSYLKHLMEFHQRTTRRYRLGSSIGEGVIIKDGKYECQICHKVFQERRSYNGHVGIHVRNYVRSSEELPAQATVQKSIDSPSQDGFPPNGLPPRISKMDALIEIAQSSILETSTAEPNDKANDSPNTLKVVTIPEPNDKANDGPPNTPKVVTIPETQAGNSDHELGLGSDPNELENCMTKTTPGQGFNQHDGNHIMTHKNNVNTESISHVENNWTVVCTSTFEHPKLDEVGKSGNSEGEIDLGNSQFTSSHDVVTGTSVQTVKDDLQSGVADSPMPVMQSLHCCPSFTAISDKEENEFCAVDQKLDNVTGFDELRLDEIESLKFSFVNGQESPSLPELSMNLAHDNGTEEGFNSSARFESEAFMFNIAGRHQFTTVCVWCRTEFNHEAVDSENQSDSVGFMCPACKTKISGQLNVLDGGLSMNFHL